MSSLGLLLWVTAALGSPEATGWRQDGTGIVAASLPSTLSDCGQIALPSTGNASLARLGEELLCSTSEPSTLWCASRSSGKVVWSKEHPVTSVLPEGEASALQAQLDALEAFRVRSEREQWRRGLAESRKKARQGDEQAKDHVARYTEALTNLAEEEARLSWALTPPDPEVVGYASATPVSDGKTLWALFGNGVLVAYDEKGAVRWSKWLGKPEGPMRGYHRGTSSSLRWVDGLLIVPFNDLLGVDGQTGEVRWRVPDWRDYGTPTLGRLGEEVVLGTPDGRLLRARDGVELHSQLADLWYVGPEWVDGDLLALGGYDPIRNQSQGGVWARLWDGQQKDTKWETLLAGSDVYYTQPVTSADYVFSVSRSGQLWVLDRQTGEVVHSEDLFSQLRGWVWSSPMRFGDQILLTSEQGKMATLQTQPPFALAELADLPGVVRASPLLLEGRLWLRGETTLHCLGGSP